jgi:hypothetical protein
VLSRIKQFFYAQFMNSINTLFDDVALDKMKALEIYILITALKYFGQPWSQYFYAYPNIYQTSDLKNIKNCYEILQKMYTACKIYIVN